MRTQNNWLNREKNMQKHEIMRESVPTPYFFGKNCQRCINKGGGPATVYDPGDLIVGVTGFIFLPYHQYTQ